MNDVPRQEESAKASSDAHPKRPTRLHLMRLIAWCVAAWVLCGWLTWYAMGHLDGCCDLSTFARLFGFGH